MRLQDIPVGHVAKSNKSGLIVLVGQIQSYCLSLIKGFVGNNEDFGDNYEDLGELKINVEEVKQYKVNISVG